MSRRARTIVLAFAVAGLALAGASTWIHYRLLTDPTFQSPCDVNATFNCTQVYLSRFGTVRGIPVALGGVLWFALVALLSGFTSPGRQGEPGPERYLFPVATVGLAVIFYLGYASFVILRTECLFCMGTYVCVLGVFFTSARTPSVPLMKLPTTVLGDLRRVVTRGSALLAAILYVAGAAALVAFAPRAGTLAAAAATPPSPQAVAPDMAQAFKDMWAREPREDLGIPAGGARVVVVKFNDWLCPTCKAFHQAYQPILDRYAQTNPGAVRYIVRDFPLSTSCNSTIQAGPAGHEASCEASAAVRMARDRGRGDEMIAWLFGNQETLTEMDLRGKDGIAEAVEAIKAEAKTLGVTDFDREYPAKLADIRRDIAQGAALKIEGTPTFFVNGVRTTQHNSNLDPRYFDLAIQYELDKAGPGD
jgi:uncharacterized membrane protein/protein-disulfide isomerase